MPKIFITWYQFKKCSVTIASEKPIFPFADKMARIAFALLALFAATAYARMAYQLPDGAEFILRARSYSESFSCEGRNYGYYADEANNCEIFPVCLPVENDEGEIIEYAQFSFVCGNTTVFDQASMTCTNEADAIPCDESASFYDVVNAEFGVIREEYN